MSNDECRKEQHEKLRALVAPLASALDVEPADPEGETEETIWEAANELYTLLVEEFRTELGL